MQMSKRMIDLSSGGSLAPPITPRQSVQRRLPTPTIPSNNLLVQGRNIANPTYTVHEMAPIQNVSIPQKVIQSAQVQQQRPANVGQSHHTQQQQSHHTQQQQSHHTQQLGQSQPVHKEEKLINGCDVFGCRSMNDIYEKNEVRIINN